MPKNLKSSIKYCYNGTLSGLESKINIHGYYSMTFPFDKWDIKAEKYVIDTSVVNFIFFSNGLFVYNIHNYNEDLSDYLGRIAINPDSKETKDFYRHYWWGNYVVEHDTIKTFSYDPPGTTAWGARELWFVINENNTLTESYAAPLEKETVVEKASVYEIREKNRMNLSSASFHYVDTLPNPNYSWIVSAKWFRCKE